MNPWFLSVILNIGAILFYGTAIIVPMTIVLLCIYLGIERYNENHTGDTDEQIL